MWCYRNFLMPWGNHWDIIPPESCGQPHVLYCRQSPRSSTCRQIGLGPSSYSWTCGWSRMIRMLSNPRNSPTWSTNLYEVFVEKEAPAGALRHHILVELGDNNWQWRMEVKDLAIWDSSLKLCLEGGCRGRAMQGRLPFYKRLVTKIWRGNTRWWMWAATIL